MALSMATTIAQIRDLVATVTGMNHVYAASEDDDNGLPDVLGEFPCALIFPGGDTEPYVINNGTHEHTYAVMIQVLQDGSEPGAKAKNVLPFVDRIIETFSVNVTLGGRATYCLFERQSGFVELEYGGETFLGYEVVLEVKEVATASPAVGS